MGDSVQADIDAVARIGAVPTILKTIREATGLRFTLVARVLPDRWIACAVHDEIEFGLKAGGELEVATTLCSEVRKTGKPVVIDHASEDPDYRGHPTPKMYGFESYIAVPLHRKNGEYFGTVCGLDPEPRVLKDEKTLSMLQLFSQLLSLQLEAEEEREGSRIELRDEREAAQLREQFIAVLGHDVRNPLSSIVTGTALLLGTSSAPAERKILERMRSSATRIAALVDDVLDLTRGRLGGGIQLAMATIADVDARVRHVVDELRSVHPERVIELRVSHVEAVDADVRRIEQLVSNLLANAIEHGARDTPIEVTIGGDERTFELRVENQGPPIPEATRARLFQPYFRGDPKSRKDGLGLGLYIVSEIARAHGGRIDIQSNAERTRFELTMPRSATAPTR